MKRLYKSLAIGLVCTTFACGMTSCDLDETNPSGSTADVVFATPDGIQTVVNQLYYNFRWKFYGREDPVLYMEGGTDLWFNAGKSTYGAQMTQYNEKLNSSTGQFANVWNRMYDNVNLCNTIINRVPNISYTDAALKASHDGEARWARAYAYWWLVEFFGDIELRTQETSDAVFTATRTPAKDIYDQVIIPDAQKACEELPVKPVDGLVGRYTKKAAYGLLARVALTRAEYETDATGKKKYYQMAYDAAKYVMDHKADLGISLYKKYDDVWNAANNKTNTEYLAIVTHSSNSTLNPQSGNPNRLHMYYGPKLNGHVGIKTTTTSWDYYKESTLMMPTKYLLQLYKEGDMRYDALFQEAFLAPNQFTWTAKSGDLTLYKKDFNKIKNKTINVGDTALYFTRKHISQAQKDAASYAVVDIDMLYNSDGTIVSTEQAGNSQINYSFPRFMKYRIYDAATKTQLAVDASSKVGYADVPLMRYAEMQLIAAEAAMYLGNKDEAASIINDMRSRIIRPGYENAMKVSASDMTIDFILDERARELCGEHLRWFDLKRTGTLVSYIKAHNPDITMIKDYHVLRPIPQTFLNKLTNADEFGQNAGY